MIPSVVHSDEFARSHPFTFLVYETYAFNRAALGGRPGTEALGSCCGLEFMLRSTAREGWFWYSVEKLLRWPHTHTYSKCTMFIVNVLPSTLYPISYPLGMKDGHLSW